MGVVVHLFLLLLSLAAVFSSPNVTAQIVSTIERGGEISSSEHWQANAIHHVTDSIVVNKGATLTIEEGAIVKFSDDQRLDVYGLLIAEGSESSPIIFTSIRDDSGGDTNNDGVSQGEREDWQGIFLYDNETEVGSTLTYTDIRYAGKNQGYYDSEYGYYGGEGGHPAYHAYYGTGSSQPVGTFRITQYGAAVTVAQQQVTLSNNSFASIVNGIRITSASPTIVSNHFQGHKKDGVGVELESGSPRIEDNHFQALNIGVSARGTDFVIHRNQFNNNNTGITVSSPTGHFTISSNTLENHHYTAIKLDNYWGDKPTVTLTDNTMRNNRIGLQAPFALLPTAKDNNTFLNHQESDVFVKSFSSQSKRLEQDLQLSAVQGAKVYQFSSTVTVMPTATLTLGAGMILKFPNYGGIDVQGTLTVNGDSTQPVVFTSDNDDYWSGNVTHISSQRLPGDWRGLHFTEGARAQFIHTTIHYANRAIAANSAALSAQHLSIANAKEAAVYLTDTANFTGEQVEIYGTVDHGFWVSDHASLILSSSSVFGNGQHAVYTTGQAQARITNTDIFANGGSGIQHEGVGDISASQNWWGANDGPSGQGRTGSGATVVTTNNGLVITADAKTQGVAYTLFDAGGGLHQAHQIPQPTVSGVPSTAWGSRLFESVVSHPERLQIQYEQLSSSHDYELLLTYYDGGHGQAQQSIQRQQMRSAPFSLGATPLTTRIKIPSQHISDGQLDIGIVNHSSDSNSLLSSVLLIAKPKTNTTVAQPTISVEALNDGAFVNSHTVLTGRVTGDVATIEVSIVPVGTTEQWATVTAFDQTSWTQAIPTALEEGRYQFNVRVRDRHGYIATLPNPITVILDQQAPIVDTVDLLSTENGIMVSWALLDSTLTTDESLVTYRIRRSLQPHRYFRDLAETQATFFHDQSAVADAVYYYQMIAEDAAGNAEPPITVGPVLNRYIPDTIAPEEVAVLDIHTVDLANSARVNVSWQHSPNTQKDLKQYQLYFSADGTQWGTNAPNYDNGQFVTISRNKTTYSLPALWRQPSLWVRMTSVDTSDNESQGRITHTDVALSAVVTLPEQLTGDLSIPSGVYHVASTLTIAEDATMTLEPGSVFKFAEGASLIVRGHLETPLSDTPTVFTAMADDEYGGDTNGDGDSTGTAGDWGSIIIVNSSTDRTHSSASAVLDSILVRYGGGVRYNYGGGFRYYADSAAVLNRGASLVLRNSTIEKSAATGLSLVTAQGQYSSSKHAVDVIIDNNRLQEHAQWGMKVDFFADLSITRNYLTKNEYALSIPADSLHASNHVENNTHNFIEINKSQVWDDAHFYGNEQSTSVYLLPHGLIVGKNSKITVDPGVILKIRPNRSVDIEGVILAEGTPEKPILITSEDDTSTNSHDVPRLIEHMDYWGSFTVNDSLSSHNSRLAHVIMRYGGDRYSEDAMLTIAADMRVQDSHFSNSDSSAIHIQSAQPTLLRNQLIGNVQHGILISGDHSNDEAIELSSHHFIANRGYAIDVAQDARVNIAGSAFVGNNTGGIHASESLTVSAASNWWGEADQSGPSTANNPTGRGSTVSDGVNYAPYLRNPLLDYVHVNFAPTTVVSGNMTPPTVLQGEATDEMTKYFDQQAFAELSHRPRPNHTQFSKVGSAKILHALCRIF